MKALVSNPHLLSRLASLTVGKSFSQGADLREIPVPAISDSEILVKVHAVALNPTDFKHIDAISPPGCIIGCDFAGEVARAGKTAAKSWNVGDRVAGAVHGGLYPDRGAFAEYLRTDGDLAWRIPEGMDAATASTYGISAVTAMQALNARHGLPRPGKQPKKSNPQGSPAPTIFIYAASTASGLFAVQLAKAAGYTVAATASPHSFDLVKGYGADAVFDYHDPKVAEDVVRAYPDISMALDCFSAGGSTDICDAIIAGQGGKVVVLLPTTKPKQEGVEHELIMSYTLFGHPFQWLPPIGPKFAAIPSDRQALVDFYATLPELTKTIRPPPIRLEGKGFEAILTGLEKLRLGKVSGNKLVVTL